MSKFLSLDWFKGRVENSIDRVIANKLDSMTEEDNSSSVIIKQIRLVNDQLTVVTDTGRIFTKTDADEDTFHAVNNAKTEQQLESLMMNQEVADQTTAI